MVRHPPISPPFPYTTLFRSVRDGTVLAQTGAAVKGDLPYRVDKPWGHELIWARDRKSTRLNSSHRCISYAVFCLKKKNHGRDEHRVIMETGHRHMISNQTHR